MRVIVKTSRQCTHSYHSGEQYGDWSESYSSSVESVRIADKDDDCGYNEDGYLIADGSTDAHVISVTYSSGDSFGSSSGNIDVLAVFGNRAKAEACLQILKEKIKDDYSIPVTDDFDREIKVYNPAAGYFESVESLDLETFNLANPNVRITF